MNPRNLTIELDTLRAIDSFDRPATAFYSSKRKMPPIISEAYARGLVNKIMTEAFDVLETTAQSETPMAHHQAEDIADPQEPTDSEMRIHTESDGLPIIGQMETVLRGLSELQIRVPTLTLDRQLTLLEEQVKRTVCSINNAMLCEPLGTAGTYVVRGQGDVYGTISQTHDESQSTPGESTTPTKDKEHEATKVSENLLHQMIEDLESGPIEPITAEQAEPRDNEETSEQTDNLEELSTSIGEPSKKDSTEAISFELECASHSYDIDDPKISTTMLPSTSFARHASLEEVPITATMSESPGRSANTGGFLAADEIHETPSLCEIKERSKRLKKGFFGRIRRLICTAFGKRKD